MIDESSSSPADGRVERYTHGHHESVVESHSRRTVNNSAAYLLPHLVAGRSLLDVGCGPGTITVDFAERLAPGVVVGVDAAESVLDGARRLAAVRLAGDNLSFLAGDVYALPFDDGGFDIVHAHQLAQHVADPVRMLREMRRVTAPRGIVAVREVDHAAIAWYPLLPGLARWMRVLQDVHRANGGEPNAGRHLTAWAHAAGFASVSTSASIWCFSTPETRAWWGGSWAVRSLESGFATDALAAGIATRADLEEISAAWTEWSEHQDAVFMMPHGEIIASG